MPVQLAWRREWRILERSSPSGLLACSTKLFLTAAGGQSVHGTVSEVNYCMSEASRRELLTCF